MYVNKRQVTMQRGIATLLAIALVLWAVGVHMFTTAEAANLLYVKNTLSDSAPSSVSNHEIEFLQTTAFAAGGTTTITFPLGFNLSTSSLDIDDIDLEVNGVAEGKAAALGTPASGALWGFSISGQDLIITSGTDTIGALATVTVKIGTNAASGVNQVTNHSATSSYEFSITSVSSNGTDTGQTRVAIIENVLVTANVDTTLTFTVSGTTTGAVLNGSAVTTFGPSTNLALPFGNLQDSVPKTLGQDLTVATNARNGYVVTVEQDSNLQSATLADIDGFIDGAYTNTPTGWVSPGNLVANENTWGHWGLTSNDPTLLGAGSDFGVDEWVSASTTPRAIMAHAGPADGVTLGVGRATIGYQIEITALQEAGDDYSTVLTYIATPTF